MKVIIATAAKVRLARIVRAVCFRLTFTTIKISAMQRHSFTALNSNFVVDSEYQFVKELGQGAYGCVVAARHRRSGDGCAIKKITNINTKVRCCPISKVPIA